MLKKVLLIVNPGSGKGLAEQYSQKLQAVIEASHQGQVQIKQTQAMEDAYNWAKKASQEGFDTVICFGGDGTVKETVSGLLDGGQPLPDFSFIPLGTVNDLGRALNMPLNPEKFIQAFERVNPQKVDIGRINQEYFINTIAIGKIAEAVMDTSSSEKNKLGKLAYIKDGFQAAMDDTYYDIEVVDSQQKVHRFQTNLLIIGLTNSVGGFEIMNKDAEVNDGLAYVSAVKGTNLIDVSRAMVEGKLFDVPTDKLFLLEDSKFTISENGNQPVASNVDGDPGPKLPLEIEVIHEAITVLVPVKKD